MAYSETFESPPADEYTMVAENVTDAWIRLLSDAPTEYRFASVATGGTPPVNKADGAVASGKSIKVENITPLDVYLFPVGAAGYFRLETNG